MSLLVPSLSHFLMLNGALVLVLAVLRIVGETRGRAGDGNPVRIVSLLGAFLNFCYIYLLTTPRPPYYVIEWVLTGLHMSAMIGALLYAASVKEDSGDMKDTPEFAVASDMRYAEQHDHPDTGSSAH